MGGGGGRLQAEPSTLTSVASACCAGLLFAVGLQIKYIGVVYSPLALLLIWARDRRNPSPLKSVAVSLTLFAGALLVSFVGINLLTGSPLRLQLEQSWSSHFAENRSYEYGSPADHPFDWLVLLKNWDLTLPAAAGVCFMSSGALRFAKGSLRRLQRAMKPPRKERTPGASVTVLEASDNVHEDASSALLVCWLVLSLLVFSFHKPWWQYYYIHNALPLCLCAAVGVIGAWRKAMSRPPQSIAVSRVQVSPRNGTATKRARNSTRLFRLVVGAYILCAGPWMAGRVYLQVSGIRHSPQTYSSLVLKEIERFKPLTQFMFTDQPVYSFHSRVPLPPNLGILSLKRFWTGDMTTARLVAELEAGKPGLILLGNSARERPYQEVLDREYRLVYQDGSDSLYAHRSIAGKAKY